MIGIMIYKYKKYFLPALIVVLVLEGIWAVIYIKSAKITTNPATVRKISPTPVKILEKIGSLSLDPVKIETKVTEQFTVKIIADTNGRELNGIDAQILYDPKMLTVVDSDNQTPGVQAENGELFNSLLINSADPVEGKINLTGSRLSKATKTISGKGTFALISFIAQKAGTTKIKINFDPGKTNTSNMAESGTSKNILTNVSDCEIQISQ